jgi:multicomponent Na+:H+ antiporter subunit D
MMAWMPVVFVMLPILTAIVVYLFNHPKITMLVLISQALLLLMFALYLPEWMNGVSRLIVFSGWNELFAISFYLDELSMLFVGLTVVMWMVVLLYTYHQHRHERLYFFFLMFLEGVFLGLVQTNDLFNLFVFLELVTILVTILIAYKKTGKAFRAALFYLLVNTVGAMFFLLGIIFLYYVYGTINIQYLAANMGWYSDQDIVKLAYVMMLSGISIKAAFFPLFTWLPRAHGVAQTAISALLSGLIVKGALYLFIKINIIMFANAAYETETFFFYVGAVTGIVGVLFALVQKDLKQILAFHTVSQIGIVMMGLSAATGLSYTGGLLHLINHAFFKSLLFLGAGHVIATYQTKKYNEIHGVASTMPWTAIVLVVAMLSITGAPLFNGFVSKSLVKYSFKYDQFKMVIFTLINIGTVTSFVKFAGILFGSKQAVVVRHDWRQYVAMGTLALACIVIGTFYLPIGQLLFSTDLSYVHLTDLQQWLDYVVYVIVGVLVYRLVIKKDYSPLQQLRSVAISFEDANYMFILYFAAFAGVIFFII